MGVWVFGVSGFMAEFWGAYVFRGYVGLLCRGLRDVGLGFATLWDEVVC